MQIVTLNQSEYREYANIHSKRNFGQTIEYSMLNFNTRKKRMFLGLVDSSNNIHAAALILIKSISPSYYEAFAPNGFLIDYSDFELVKTFTILLKKYLKSKRIVCLSTNPMFKNNVYNKSDAIIENNVSILSNMYEIDYQSLGYKSDFERYDVIIENNNSESDIYKNFNRNTKRNIKEGLNLGLTLHRGTIEELKDSYEIFKKKTKKPLSYYENLMNIYNNEDNKMEIFFAKLDPKRYLINTKRLYEEERIKNEKLHRKFEKTVNTGHGTEKTLNKKINSDSTLEKYSQELNKAINLNQKTTESIIIGTCIIIRNNHEIYFLIDGYKEKYRTIHSTHILKWAIIKKYFEKGYRVFNLGEIHKDYRDPKNKYRGQYNYKIGFGGNIVEYPPELLLVINRPMFHILNKLKKKKSK